MEKHIDCTGMACPLPVVQTKNALRSFTEEGTLNVRVDNEIAVQNLTRFAKRRDLPVSHTKASDDDYTVTLTVSAAALQPDAQNASPEAATPSAAFDDADLSTCIPCQKTAVVIASDRMGEGDEELGKTLMKAFLFALTSQDKIVDYLIFYNKGAYLTCEGSTSLEDIRALEKAGTKVFTCGTCLNYYGLTDKCAVGAISNMYDIVEMQLQCQQIIRP